VIYIVFSFLVIYVYFENMKLFIIPSWYPTKLSPNNGCFFKKWAEFLNKSSNDVVVIAPVLHSLRLFFDYHKKSRENGLHMTNKVPTFISENINIFPKNEKCAFYRYKSQTINLFNQAVDRYGKPDLVLCHSSIWAGAAISKKLKNQKIPFVIVEHLKEFLIKKSLSSFAENVVNQTYDLCNKIIVPSNALKEAIHPKYNLDERKIAVIPNPIDEDVFTLKPRKQKNYKINISCVSLLRKEKRIDLIVDSFKEIIKDGINAQLNIIGSGELNSTIKKQIKKLGLSDKIKLTGYLKEGKIVEKLHKTDVFIMASDVETFGLSLIEAQACGIPAVVTKCGGPNDIIIEKTGLLVETNSVQSLSNGLKKIIFQIDQYDPNIIRDITINRFGKDIYIKSIQSLINNLLKSQKVH
tara:strand:+ start:5234 stop:6463 length:1230 start_codon:yes stop_codon:yes gene_type:complete